MNSGNTLSSSLINYTHLSSSDTNTHLNNTNNNNYTNYEPVKDIIYNKNGSNSNRSVYVTPRRAYYDTRKVPLNRLIILTQVQDNAVKSILACEINGAQSISIKLKIEDVRWVRSRKRYRRFTHRLVIIQCLGIREESIINGSFPSVIYRKEGDDYYSRVEAERPLYITEHEDGDASTFDRGSGSVVVCCTLFDEPEKLDHWLIYQKTLNVDMVHLNVDTTFYRNATRNYPFLVEALDSGFVKMDVWENVIDDRYFYKDQLVKYQDCLYRYMGVFEYGFFLDFDDYFNPSLTQHKDIHFYLDKYFEKKNIGSVNFAWHHMSCKPSPELLDNLTDGNISSILSGNESYWRAETKTCYRLNACQFIHVHFAVAFLPGFHNIVHPNKDSVYVAHVRHTSSKLC